jgi:hypothetical protein
MSDYSAKDIQALDVQRAQPIPQDIFPANTSRPLQRGGPGDVPAGQSDVLQHFFAGSVVGELVRYAHPAQVHSLQRAAKKFD